ncbi:hypothetical protein AX15_006593 [Amanita polypyramis BW_CC]|nr:hypothetical protein AX15_006593 [Amanita polypyramis BW_CC]
MQAEQDALQTSQSVGPSSSSGDRHPSQPYHSKRHWRKEKPTQEDDERPRDVKGKAPEGRPQGLEKGPRLGRRKAFGSGNRTAVAGGSQDDKKATASAPPSRASTPVQGSEVKSGQSRPPNPRTPHRAHAQRSNPGFKHPAPMPEDTPSSAKEPSSHLSAQSRQHDSGRSYDKQKYKPKPMRQDVADDLTSTLIKSLSTRPYPDCPICFSAILPNHPTWSCSPSTPQVPSASEDGSTLVPQYCWTTFHIKCIRSWAEKSVKALEEAWRNRGEMDKRGEWRCPGCQAKREIVPVSYWCFCHSTPDPKPSRLATPHSCANPCTRPREAGCGHACPLLCHPGPCPPCQVVMQVPCPCPRRKIAMLRCGDGATPGGGKARGDSSAQNKVVSCNNVCGRILDCGKHSCQRVCHPGTCGSCELVEEAKCYCGRISKQLRCGDGEPVPCSVHIEEGDEMESWIGRFECEHICDRLFDCRIHRCQKLCHPPSSEPDPCPFSPDKITHCSCGKHTIAPSDHSSGLPEGRFTFPPRQDCSAPIPTCDSTCGKIHPLCGHGCAAKCHLGSCPPCSIPTTRPCRCGLTIREIKCAEFIAEEGEKEILCDRPCTVLRACGRHECRRSCCPLASLAIGKTRKGRGAGVDTLQTSGIGEEEGGLHECDLPCGKLLSCGNHTCERKDHKGPCPPCLRSTFEEVICPCGRTILEPPVPCGTKIDCRFQCPRQPSCGHPAMSHTCHEESYPCPPCAYLTTKLCACGKKEMMNVKCSLERDKVSCATVCERLLSCGFHRCQRLCHAGDCGACATPCGKDRKLCLPAHHSCTLPCHAPSTCPEDNPCEALVAISCPCGRFKQSVRCGRNSLLPNSSTSSVSLKCNSQCEIAKRNARLAEALGINEETRERAGRNMAGGLIVYPDEVVAFAKDDPKFVLLVEKTFAEFITSNKRAQVLPHMPQEKRKFAHSLAGIYRLDVQMVDQEPVRSIQVMRRLDSRVPHPLLSTYVGSATTPPPPLGFGKLGLSANANANSAWRVPSKPASPAPAPAPAPTQVVPPVPGMTASGARGWGSTGNSKPATSAIPVVPGVPLSTSGVGGRSMPSRSTTPNVGSGAESAAAGIKIDKVGGGDESVPDNWEDDV